MGCTQTREMLSDNAATLSAHKSNFVVGKSFDQMERTHDSEEEVQPPQHHPTGGKVSDRSSMLASRQSNSPDRTTTSGSSPNSAIDPGMFIQQTKAHLSERYIRERKLGSGAYGEVLLCRDKQSGAECAVKVIKKSSVSNAAGTNLLEEVAVVKQLDHPNIMKLYEFFEDKKYYYLVSELYKGGELFDEIINRQKFTGMIF